MWVDSDWDVAAKMAARVGDHVWRWLQGANRLQVSRDKSVAVGSSGRVAKKLSTHVVAAHLKPVSRWKMLGTGVNGGRRRSVAYFRERLKTA